MNNNFIVQGTENVIDLFKYRSFREAIKLFGGWKLRLLNMDKRDINNELIKIRQEYNKYPTHVLTKAKIEIFENATKIKVINE